ncbi:glycerol acyltransferase [Prevotella herbatica]|uniref:Glycerol acyltransferase n=1 Tax=Prevotella herbatica TaxID=2801997 RepID=A0ABM7NZJ2_9BACT|nr:1-acyl-sn-glycerol-3-phosphate acyltransferase [Prevotella herbatica]BCS85941.1 glycerol acyltransferase [Prevotella herbatica]
MLKIYDILSKNKVVASLILFIFCVVAIILATGIHYEEDIAKFLPHNAQNEKYQDVYQRIALQNRIAVMFTAKDSTRPVDTDSLEAAMETLGGEISHSKLIDNLQVSVNETKIFDIIQFVGQNYPYFLTKSDYQHIDSLLSDDNYVKDQLSENKKLLMLPTAGMALQNMKYDPVHLFSPVLKRLQNFQLNSRFQVIDGYLFFEDEKMSIITMNSKYGSSETHENGYIADMLDRAIAKTQKQYPNIHISAIGAPLIAVSNANQIKSDSLLAVSIASVLILLILWLHYRKISDIIWIGISLAFGWLFAIAGMALFNDEVSIIVLGIGSVIIGIAVNYPLHFLDHIREVHDRRAALKEMIPPLLIGNITTVAAFLCLIWLDAQAMRDLGVFGSLMLVGTILFVLVFLPLYAKQSKKNDHNDSVSIVGKLIEKVENYINTGAIRRYVFPVVVIITLILGYYSLQTSFDSDLSHINYMTADQKRDMKMLSGMQTEAPLYAVAEGRNLDEALNANEHIGKVVQGTGCKMSGIGNFVPSEMMQREALTRWNNYWQHGKGKALVAKIKKEAALQGYSSGAFTPFYDMMNADHHVKNITYFNPIINLLNGTFILNDNHNCKIVNYLTSVSDTTKIRQKINSTNCYAFSSKDIGNQLVILLNNSFNYIGFVCGFVVFFFLWLSFGKIELSLMSFLPLAVSWVWILGIMHVFGVQFNIVNIILATFIFGQGDDYTIFITEGLMYEYATGKKRLASYKRSVAISSILMFIGIGSLVIARHPALRSLATVTIIGMFTVVVMAYYLPPLVFRLLTVKNGNIRKVPLTLRRFAYSLGSMLFFLAIMYFFLLPFTWFYFHIGRNTEKKKLRYHKLLYNMANIIVNKIPGVKFKFNNLVGEKFDKPAVIISNHLSHLDTLCLMTLCPKMIFITNKWAWNNHFYGSVIHQAEFLPASDGLDAHIDDLRSLYSRGYSICIFPEGTRSVDHRLHRFHKGAFYLAELLHADIVPVVMHGQDHVLPKTDFMLREGTMSVRILQRISSDDTSMGTGYRELTHNIHKLYVDEYAKICAENEDAAYYVNFVKSQYRYKGLEIERRCKRNIKSNDSYSSVIDADSEKGLAERAFHNAGLCELPYLYALVHPSTSVNAYVDNEDDYVVVKNMAYLPQNLNIYHKDR